LEQKETHIRENGGNNCTTISVIHFNSSTVGENIINKSLPSTDLNKID